MSDNNYKSIERAFKKLWGFPDRIIPDTEVDGIPFLIEANFTQNISEVTGQESPFFGKLLYLYFSGGLDRVKISLQKFAEGLKPYTNDDERVRHAKTSFKILDLDNDGVLNVINLLHLHKHIPDNTPMGLELFEVIQWFLEKNMRNKSILKK
jgi:hypothetical protein